MSFATNMESSCSDNESLSFSEDDSENNFIPGRFFPVESELANEHEAQTTDEIHGFEPYTAEPLADENWLEQYKKRREEKQQLQERLKDRLSGKETISNW